MDRQVGGLAVLAHWLPRGFPATAFSMALGSSSRRVGGTLAASFGDPSGAWRFFTNRWAGAILDCGFARAHCLGAEVVVGDVHLGRRAGVAMGASPGAALLGNCTAARFSIGRQSFFSLLLNDALHQPAHKRRVLGRLAPGFLPWRSTWLRLIPGIDGGGGAGWLGC